MQIFIKRSHLSLNSLLSRLLDYRRDYVEPDVGCSRKKKRQARVNTFQMILKVFMETSCMLNEARSTGTITHTHTHTSPLGILNLLSFLYHRQPLSLSAIRTGKLVSGQSEGFRVKSVAEQIQINNKTLSLYLVQSDK